MDKAVFLDRDGIINYSIVTNNKPHPPRKIITYMEGIFKLCHHLIDNDYLLIIVTNQPDIARGKITIEEVNAMNNRIRQSLPIWDVFVCPHDDLDYCECRKPNPGMLLEAARKHNLDLKQSWMIGDRWKDIEAGDRAGCQTIFVDYGYRESRPARQIHTVADIREIQWYFGGEKYEG